LISLLSIFTLFAPCEFVITHDCVMRSPLSINDPARKNVAVGVRNFCFNILGAFTKTLFALFSANGCSRRYK